MYLNVKSSFRNKVEIVHNDRNDELYSCGTSITNYIYWINVFIYITSLLYKIWWKNTFSVIAIIGNWLETLLLGLGTQCYIVRQEHESMSTVWHKSKTYTSQSWHFSYNFRTRLLKSIARLQLIKVEHGPWLEWIILGTRNFSSRQERSRSASMWVILSRGERF